jgi:hypothetical protein
LGGNKQTQTEGFNQSNEARLRVGLTCQPRAATPNGTAFTETPKP